MRYVSLSRILVVVAIATAFRGDRRAHADDWPRWRGPRREVVSGETGLLPSWPAGGPRFAWQVSGLGTGYASVVVGRTQMSVGGIRAFRAAVPGREVIQ